MRPAACFAAVVPASLPFLLAVMNAAAPLPPSARLAIRPRVEYAQLADLPPATLPEHAIVLTVEKGDTFASVLQDGGLSTADALAVIHEVGRLIDLRALKPGNLVRFHYDKEAAVDSVEMKIAGWGEVDAARNGSAFRATAHPAQIVEIETSVSATIDSSLYDALVSTGEGPQLAQQIVDIFQWDIDFFALQRGDSFSLVVKKKYIGADPDGYGPILAARFIHDGQTFEAFHEDSGGRAGYYARNGTPLRKQFLRAPLHFTRITSKFSHSRWHPILHCFRPHLGVDYGAPVGTPVMSTADGVVVEARHKGADGNLVRIRHTSRLQTYYLHLSRFARGIHPGTKVQQGQVIGYVGATGLATGPHLDYRVLDAGKWLDPLKLKSIAPDPLSASLLQTFRAKITRLENKLAAPTSQVAELASRRRALF